MINPDSLAPDFKFTEYYYPSSSVQIMSCQTEVDSASAHFDAYKIGEGDKKPYYALSWSTDWIARRALELFDNIDSLIPGVKLAGVTSRQAYQDEDIEYLWIPPTEVSPAFPTYTPDEVASQNTQFLRIDIVNKAAVIWRRKAFDQPKNNIDIIAYDPISSPWIRILMGHSATPEARRTIDRNIGRIASNLKAFIKTPYGTPLLEGGFTHSDTVTT